MRGAIDKLLQCAVSFRTAWGPSAVPAAPAYVPITEVSFNTTVSVILSYRHVKLVFIFKIVNVAAARRLNYFAKSSAVSMNSYSAC